LIPDQIKVVHCVDCESVSLLTKKNPVLRELIYSLFPSLPMLHARALNLVPAFRRVCNPASAIQARGLHVEKRLDDLGIDLPPAPTPKANYNIVCHASGGMMYISGHLPLKTDGTLITGRIGPASGGETIKHGYEAARQAGLNIISTLKEQLGNLDRVEKVVKVFGIVQSNDDFKEQHLVMDGCSDVIMQVFGKDVGYHARSAIGTSTLPLDMSVEVEAIVQVKP
jgi:enamine deaminase RidA (YjgF/YER057c/UK114 family)